MGKTIIEEMENSELVAVAESMDAEDLVEVLEELPEPLAEYVAGRPPTDLFGTELHGLARAHMRQIIFTQTLNRLLFRWFPPAARVAIFERFYRLPRTTIGHFYALRLTWLDAFRLITFSPPRGMSLRHRLRRGSER